jgi:hypothetical protein
MEPDKAPAAALSSDLPPLASFPTDQRPQQYHKHFEKYKDTWEGSLPSGKKILGALYLHPYVFEPVPGVAESAPPELRFAPQLVWFVLRPRTKLEQVMREFARVIQIEPSRLYFYYGGEQVNCETTIDTVSIPPYSWGFAFYNSLTLTKGVG